MKGPYLLIVRRCGGGWEMLACFRYGHRGQSWARTRGGIMETVRVVMK